MANTTQKGDLFENDIYKIVKQLVAKGKFSANPATAEVYQKKKYPSKDNSRGVIFDVTVESFFTKDSPKYSVLYAIECKNYSRTVGIEVVRELRTKLCEVGSDNTKGLILTKKGFQKGAIEAARENGIALGLLKK